MIYFDNAATTFPKPQCMVDEMNSCIKKYCGNPGRSSHALSLKSSEKIYETRCLLGEFFGTEPENIVFTLNTTYALNIAIKSKIVYGSHILISDLEHNSVLRPIYELTRLHYCSYSVFSTKGSDEEIIENIKKELKKDTKMLVCTALSNICSKKLPLELIGRLCKERDIYFIVDGAQGAGFLDININKMYIDALCIPAHKSLYGPQGVGAVLFRENKVNRSFIEGGTGINSKELQMPDILPEAYEAGTMPTPQIAGLCGALKWLKAVERDKIKMYEEELYSYLVSKLSKMERVVLYDYALESGNTLIFNIEGISATTLSGNLDKRGICTRSGLHCAPLAHKALGTIETGAVRVSLGVYNTKSEINCLCDALEEIKRTAPCKKE